MGTVGQPGRPRRGRQDARLARRHPVQLRRHLQRHHRARRLEGADLRSNRQRPGRRKPGVPDARGLGREAAKAGRGHDRQPAAAKPGRRHRGLLQEGMAAVHRHPARHAQRLHHGGPGAQPQEGLGQHRHGRRRRGCGRKQVPARRLPAQDEAGRTLAEPLWPGQGLARNAWRADGQGRVRAVRHAG